MTTKFEKRLEIFEGGFLTSHPIQGPVAMELMGERPHALVMDGKVVIGMVSAPTAKYLVGASESFRLLCGIHDVLGEMRGGDGVITVSLPALRELLDAFPLIQKHLEAVHNRVADRQPIV